MKRLQDKVFLTRVNDVFDPGCLSFSIERDCGYIEGFLVKMNSEFRAYLNSCPHTGINLNWNPHDFFDVDKEFIQCSMHGALFQPLDGLCVYGPCIHKSLHTLDIVIESGQLYLLVQGTNYS